MVELFANSGDPDQTSHFAASALFANYPLGSPDYNGLMMLTQYFLLNYLYKSKCC